MSKPRPTYQPAIVRLAVAASLTLAAALAAAPIAGASSITYAKGDSVWASTPDGARQVQVTRGASYSEPSQADDGTIVAIGSDNGIYRIARDGRVLSGPVLTWLKYYGGQGFSGPYGAKVSPNGSKVAFTFFHTQQVVDGGSGYPELGTSYSYSDRTTAANDIGLIREFGNPSWIDNSHTAIFAPGVDGFGDPGLQNVAFHELGGADPSATDDMAHAYLWFNDAAASYIQSGEVSRNGDSFAAVEGSPAAPERIRIYSVSATPPSPASQSNLPVFQCELDNAPSGGYQQVSWSPDGSQLAYQAGSDIYVLSVGSVAGGCPQLGQPRLLVAGGTSPDWGPADVSPAAGPGASPGAAPGGGQTAPVSAPRLSSVAFAGRRLEQALAGGLRVRASLDRAATVRGNVTLDAASARKVGLRRATRIASGITSLRTAGRLAITLRFTPRHSAHCVGPHRSV